MNEKILFDLWQNHSGKIIGSIIGLFMSVFIIIFGFFHTLFVISCMIIGYVVGKRIDEKENIMDILDRLLPPGYHR